MRKAYRNEDVDLIALARESPFVLRGFTFEGCKLLGPAVLVPVGPDLTFDGNTLAPQGFWEVPQGRIYIGSIGIMECRFQGCDFSEIGLAGDRDFIDVFFQESIPPHDQV